MEVKAVIVRLLVPVLVLVAAPVKKNSQPVNLSKLINIPIIVKAKATMSRVNTGLFCLFWLGFLEVLVIFLRSIFWRSNNLQSNCSLSSKLRGWSGYFDWRIFWLLRSRKIKYNSHYSHNHN